jgi:SAM-dependent methyltransferase
MTDPAGHPEYLSKFDAAGSRSADAARQILDITRPFRSASDGDLVVLDVGCGYGHTAAALAEPSTHLYEQARAVITRSGLTNVDLRPVGIEDVAERGSFDLVVLDNVFEHISDQPRALAAIVAATKPDGILYLLVPNKLWPLEHHYGLLFLSYIPLSLANRYLRLTGRGSNYADASNAPTYGRLVKLLREAGLTANFVVPNDLSLTAGGGPLHYRIGAAALRRVPWLWRLAKGFLVVGTRTR